VWFTSNRIPRACCTARGNTDPCCVPARFERTSRPWMAGVAKVGDANTACCLQHESTKVVIRGWQVDGTPNDRRFNVWIGRSLPRESIDSQCYRRRFHLSSLRRLAGHGGIHAPRDHRRPTSLLASRSETARRRTTRAPRMIPWWFAEVCPRTCLCKISVRRDRAGHRVWTSTTDSIRPPDVEYERGE